MARSPSARAGVGARRRRFVIERPLDAPDGFGGTLRRFVPGPVVWGALTPLGTRDRVQGGRTDPVATHRLALRYRPGLAPPMRLVDGARRYAIRSAADPDGGRRDLVCEVEEILGGEILGWEILGGEIPGGEGAP